MNNVALSVKIILCGLNVRMESKFFDCLLFSVGKNPGGYHGDGTELLIFSYFTYDEIVTIKKC
jgi:hypothetical protein